MATTYKDFSTSDIINSKTLLYENIPMTGTLVSGTTYNAANIKSYSHGIFQSVYDYPATSASANQLFDMSAGVITGSPGYLSTDTNLSKKVNMYNQMAQVLLGYDATGSILVFDRDGDTATDDVDEKYRSCFILNFNRLLVKDEIKKGSFQLTLGVGSSSNFPFSSSCIISDVSGNDSYRVNSPTGEYGILYATNFSGINNDAGNPNRSVGLVFYQAGVAVISTNIFAASSSNSTTSSMTSNKTGQLLNACTMSATYTGTNNLWRSGSIDDINAVLRSRIGNLSINNTTQLNSTIHFCRIGSNDFNYSSNPTYLTSSKIVVKEGDVNKPPNSYITTVGLYSADNQLLAVAKLSQPLKKTPENEMILRVRLDY